MRSVPTFLGLRIHSFCKLCRSLAACQPSASAMTKPLIESRH